MSRPAPQIRLSTEEKETLLGWMRSSKIALKMKTRPARVSKWLRRFAKERIAALNDTPRSGEKRRKYTRATEERILKVLDEAPPVGYSRWNGRLIAQQLGRSRRLCGNCARMILGI